MKDLEKISLKNAILKMHEKRINSNKTFGQIMSKAISDSIETLLLVLGTITVFLTITSIINNILHIFFTLFLLFIYSILFIFCMFFYVLFFFYLFLLFFMVKFKGLFII